MISFPNAKINLGLRITGRRPDGFHNLSTVFLPVSWQDAMELHENKTYRNGEVACQLTVHGLPVQGLPNENLVIKAYHLVSELQPLPPVQVHLLKSIPMGAGLGGGSANGAFMLKLLNTHFGLGLTMSQLETLALNLGSDCPFFIKNTPAEASGRGEVLSPVSFCHESLQVLLVYPGIHLSTAEAFAHIAASSHSPTLAMAESLSQPIQQWQQLFVNDFEPYAFRRFPQLSLLKQTLQQSGAVYVSMSGSGSAIYGFFTSRPSSIELPTHYTSRWCSVLASTTSAANL